MTTKKVTLIKPHTHAGKDYPAGAELAVDEPTAHWLVEQGVIAAAEGGAPKPPTKAA